MGSEFRASEVLSYRKLASPRLASAQSCSLTSSTCINPQRLNPCLVASSLVLLVPELTQPRPLPFAPRFTSIDPRNDQATLADATSAHHLEKAYRPTSRPLRTAPHKQGISLLLSTIAVLPLAPPSTAIQVHGCARLRCLMAYRTHAQPRHPHKAPTPRVSRSRHPQPRWRARRWQCLRRGQVQGSRTPIGHLARLCTALQRLNARILTPHLCNGMTSYTHIDLKNV